MDADLAHVIEYTREAWRELADARLFVTGGTGFFGRWLLASLVAARSVLGVRATATVLTRRSKVFERAWPELACAPGVTLLEGDVRNLGPPGGSFSHIIHAATPASAAFNQAEPLAMFDTIVQGTGQVLDFARAADAEAVLLCSSGAVYGRQPPELERVPEEYAGGPDPLDPHSAYAEGKRAAEFLGAVAGACSGCG